MTETQKKTVGLAIGSLVCGCFALIPIIGLLPSLPAIILGIIALVKISKNKDTLKGNGLAISGIVMGSISIFLIPIIALLSAIAIPNLLRAKISSNDALAKSTIQLLSTATETYIESTDGQIPEDIHALIDAKPPYINQNYCNETLVGFNYTCEFSEDGYIFTATPKLGGTSGSKIFTIKTGGILSEEKVEDAVNNNLSQR